MIATLSWPAFVATAAVMLAGILLHARWLPLPLFAVLAAIVAFRIAWRWRSGRRVPAWIRFVLVIGLSVAVWRTLGSLLGREAGSALLAAMLVIKLLETETTRDARLVVTVTCFIALSAFLFDQGVVQMVAAAGVVVLIFATLHVLDAAPTPSDAHARGPWSLAALRESLRYGALAVPFALICFVLFPRFSAPLWGAPQDGFQTRTGLSSEMRPGEISALALDDTPVMRVRFDGEAPPEPERYFRAMVLWWFDGETWTGNDALRSFNVPVDVRADGPVTTYEVWLDPTDQRTLFMLDAPLEAPEGATLTADLQTRRERAVTDVLNYRGRSATQATVQPQLSPRLRYFATQHSLERNPRTRELAAQWRREANGDPRTISERALAMFNRENFVYTFEPPLLDARNGVDDFLFTTRAGFCEHYASAFAYLMRAAGVPTRVVIGFQGGLYNSLGGYYVVRRSDAHAWTEIWIENQGWIRVDPTAAIDPTRVDATTREALDGGTAWSRRGWLGRIRERFDLAGLWWSRTVVQFNALRQKNLLNDFGVDPDRHPTRWSLALIGGALLALVAGGLLLGLRPARRGDALAQAWTALHDRLRAAGIDARATEGPADFARRVAAARPDLAREMDLLSARYIALRYAACEPAPGDVGAFAQDVRRFRPKRRA